MQHKLNQPPAMSRAFKQAIYQVHSPVDLVELRIGKVSGSLRKHMQALGIKHAAIISAYNPQAQLTGDNLNRHAHSTLLQAVEALQLPWWPAVNIDPSGGWPAEPSIMILGITVDQARWLARRFRQLAFVSIGPRAVPKLNFVQQHMPSFSKKNAALPQTETAVPLVNALKH
ncbi:DUF3293 domain-containing protein [Alcaligenes endophyticus]|uniref:DUF3293 domain-containing protein n=1 Tax=Alcaligenes endophyticus TaxID=1929088 RepID=A0ABT8EGW8_9BURK|nr:DUF3293 domain-containing protein [Alcaligenes endophyticus]MCX5589824.1 DUF3293 domain-containing protein [Alcaligenes endophyticus]MDN4120513.1 DUF3293 domain-containing protein [Alcaligenes endophyticus]